MALEGQDNVKDLIRDLRKMHGHVTAKDKATLVKTIGALQDLALQLYNATHLVPFKGAFTIERERL